MDSRTKKLMDKVLDIGIHDKEGMLSVMKEIGQMGKPKKSKGPKFTADSKGNVTKNYKGGGAAFPDLTGDGKVTRADILKGRGVKGFKGGGCVMKGRGGSFKGTS